MNIRDPLPQNIMLSIPSFQLIKRDLDKAMRFGRLVAEEQDFLPDAIFAEVREDEYPECVVDAACCQSSRNFGQLFPYSIGEGRGVHT